MAIFHGSTLKKLPPKPDQPIHASAFAYAGMGCLLLGASDSGKSRLVAEALIHGGQLIADDRVQLDARDGMLIASAPAALAGVLELRGLGLIRAENVVKAHPLHLVVELAAESMERLPEPQTRDYLDIQVPYLRLSTSPMTGIAPLLCYLRAMRDGAVLSTDWIPIV